VLTVSLERWPPRGLGPPIYSNQGSKWPYSGPRVAGISGVNAGEFRESYRRPCCAKQQVTASVVLAPKGRSGTLTRKWSLVQIQDGLHSGHLHGNGPEPRTWTDPDPRRRSSRGSRDQNRPVSIVATRCLRSCDLVSIWAGAGLRDQTGRGRSHRHIRRERPAPCRQVPIVPSWRTLWRNSPRRTRGT
jgi:hypothetical protein